MPRKLTDWLDAYLKFEEETEPPHLYKEWVGISVLASALERKSFIQFGNLIFYPNMYIVLVGPSGVCRKSVSMKSGRDLIDYIEINKAPDATTRVGLIGELEQSISNQQIMLDGTTVPSHCSLTVYSPELTVFLGYGQAELLTDLTSWYDCDPNWKYKTQGRGLQIITNVWVNILGATTPDLISSSMPRDTIGGGLASRMIFIYETRKGKTISLTNMPDKDNALYQSLQHDLQEINLMHGEFTYTPDFAKVFDAWYTVSDENRPTDDSRYFGYLSRRATHIIKLCMLHSVSKNSDMVIDADIFARSLDLLERTEKKMFNTFRGTGRSDLVDVTNDVMDIIKERGVISYSELIFMFHHDALKYDMDKILPTLVEMGWAKRGMLADEKTIVYKYVYVKK